MNAMPMRRHLVAWCSAMATALLLHPTSSVAQTYPSRQIRIIVPFTAGGGVDVVARLIGAKMSENVGQSVIVENRPGASGTIGADVVAKSKPDGYTILQNSTGQALAPALFRTLPFDPINDFVPVTDVVRSQSVLVIYPKLPVHTLKELVALAKAKPESLIYGVTGLGNASNLNMEMFKRAAGIEIQAVPYKGDAQLNTDLIGGQIHIAIAPLTTAKTLIDSGALRALAIFGDARSPAIPDVPTTAEALPPGFGSAGWQGWFVAGKTPPEIVARIHHEVVRALNAPDVANGLQKLGNDPGGSTPEAFGAQFRDDVDTLIKVVDEAKIPKLN
jgi:tripartite-type tricarboxylate transporter receptor subunit TctC